MALSSGYICRIRLHNSAGDQNRAAGPTALRKGTTEPKATTSTQSIAATKLKAIQKSDLQSNRMKSPLRSIQSLIEWDENAHKEVKSQSVAWSVDVSPNDPKPVRQDRPINISTIGLRCRMLAYLFFCGNANPYSSIAIADLSQTIGYLGSAISALPIITSGNPLVSSRTLFLTQFADTSLDLTAASTLSNMLMVISTSGPPSSK
jgi:hypothetical protein